MSKIHVSRTAKGRLHAAKTCAERGWKRGTFVTSDEWKKPRRLVHVDEWCVFISNSAGGNQECKTLPVDVREA